MDWPLADGASTRVAGPSGSELGEEASQAGEPPTGLPAAPAASLTGRASLTLSLSFTVYQNGGDGASPAG